MGLRAEPSCYEEPESRPRSGAAAGSAAFVSLPAVVKQPGSFNVLERALTHQKALGKLHGISGRWKHAHLVPFGFDSGLLQVYTALVRPPASSVIPQFAAVLLDHDYPRFSLQDDARIAPCDQPRQLDLGIEWRPA